MLAADSLLHACCVHATCLQELTKSVARELVSSRVYYRRIVSDTDALCCVARFYSFRVRAAACESRDTGFLACATCGLQKSMERLARLQAYDS